MLKPVRMVPKPGDESESQVANSDKRDRDVTITIGLKGVIRFTIKGGERLDVRVTSELAPIEVPKNAQG